MKLIGEHDILIHKKVFVEGLEFVDKDHLLISSGPMGGFLDYTVYDEERKGFKAVNFV